MQHFTQTITSDTFERFNNPLTIQVEEQGPCCSAKATIGAQEPCVCHLKPSTYRDQWECLIREAKRNGDDLLSGNKGPGGALMPWPTEDEEERMISCPAPPSPAETPPAPSTLSPWPSLDESEIQESPTHTDPRVLFERASAAFDQAKPRWELMSREEGWEKEAPSKFDYTGKRNKKGMPDKRTAAGKAWFQQHREEELKTALRRVLDRRSSSKND